MKIITDNGIYIQKEDLAQLNLDDTVIPVSIYMKVFGDGVTIIDDNNRFDFVKFEAEDEINFFNGLEWLLDYDDVKNLSVDELLNVGQEIVITKNNIARKFNKMPADERKKNLHVVRRCELLEYKMRSVLDFLLFIQGDIEMELPEEVKKSLYEPIIIDMPVEHEDHGIKKFVKSIFRKKQQ